MLTSRNEREIIQRMSTIFGIRSTQSGGDRISEPPTDKAASRDAVPLEELLSLDAQGVCDLEGPEEVPALAGLS